MILEKFLGNSLKKVTTVGESGEIPHFCYLGYGLEEDVYGWEEGEYGWEEDVHRWEEDVYRWEKDVYGWEEDYMDEWVCI